MADKFESVLDTMQTVRTQYAAGLQDRFRRVRTQLGGAADTHMTPFQLWRVREYVRDMDRNDMVVGQLIDRACDNIVGEGFKLEPMTSDKGLNEELKAQFHDWADDPQQCDSRGQHNFDAIGWLEKRAEFIDGDVFNLPLQDGPLQVLEAHRCGANQRVQKDTIHGIKIDERARPVEYQFSKSDSHIYHQQYSADYDPVEAFDSDGNPNVFHLFNATRFSQTRGMPAFLAVFDQLSMFEDVNFAKLVQQQVVSCIGLFIERDKEFKFGTDATLGPRVNVQDTDSTTKTLEQMRPGLVVKGRPGEKAVGFSPAVPNAQYFDHVRLILRIIGAQIGMPLTLTLLDTHDTTFHGYRGELNEAKKGFRRRQNNISDRFYTPVYRWRTLYRRKEITKNSPSAKQMFETGEIFKHKWMRPVWEYVDPLKDAQADVIQMNNLLESPRSLHAVRGREFVDIVDETIEDNGDMIEKAMQRAEKINEKHPKQGPITWREILQPLVKAQTITLTGNADDADNAAGATPGKGKPSELPAPQPQTQPGGSPRS